MARSLWVPTSKHVLLGELEHVSRLDVGKGALQRSKRLGRIRPAVLLGYDRRRAQLDRPILNTDLKLASLADTEMTPHIGGQCEPALSVDGHQCSGHVQKATAT